MPQSIYSNQKKKKEVEREKRGGGKGGESARWGRGREWKGGKEEEREENEPCAELVSLSRLPCLPDKVSFGANG